jgi:ribokinase
MASIIVSGLINIETTLKIDEFPINYIPVRFPFHGIDSTISGVGFNITKALTLLGDSVYFTSIIGQDFAGDYIRRELGKFGISSERIYSLLSKTCQSVILFDTHGKRLINTDLKDIQETSYPTEAFEQLLPGSNLAVLCNINFNRPFLQKSEKTGIHIATDVHTISDLEDPYNRDFMAFADILFMSDEQLPCSPEEWCRRVFDKYKAQIVVVGLGSQGALLCVRNHNFIERFPSCYTRPVVNTIGAGDALFSAFIHYYSNYDDPYEAMNKAIVYASYKIGANGAAEGLLDEAGLNTVISNTRKI